MTERDVVIRLVTLDDVQDLRANCFSQNTLSEVADRVNHALAMYQAREGVQLVADVDGVVVGTVTLPRNPQPLCCHRAEVEDVVVHGDYQRQGIARRMIEVGGQTALELGVEILEASCRAGTGAELAYARMGFVEYGRLPHGLAEPGGSVFDQVFYQLPIVAECRETRPLP